MRSFFNISSHAVSYLIAGCIAWPLLKMLYQDIKFRLADKEEREKMILDLAAQERQRRETIKVYREAVRGEDNGAAATTAPDVPPVRAPALSPLDEKFVIISKEENMLDFLQKSGIIPANHIRDDIKIFERISEARDDDLVGATIISDQQPPIDKMPQINRAILIPVNVPMHDRSKRGKLSVDLLESLSGDPIYIEVS